MSSLHELYSSGDVVVDNVVGDCDGSEVVGFNVGIARNNPNKKVRICLIDEKSIFDAIHIVDAQKTVSFRTLTSGSSKDRLRLPFPIFDSLKLKISLFSSMSVAEPSSLSLQS